MRAAQWRPEEGKVVVRNVPIPEPGPFQFLVKIASASLCHSDIMSINQGNAVTLGHEGAGTIVKMHESVEDASFSVGDDIGFLYIDGGCFTCDNCLIHNLHCSTGKPVVHGFTTDGFFAEYAVVDMQNCIKLPHEMDAKTASPIFCAGISAFHAVDNCELAEGDWFAIVGAGGLGQLATQIAKAMKFHVVAIDINDETLAVCKAQGADAVLNSRDNQRYVDDLVQLTGGGAKAACVFSNANAAYESAPSLLKIGGVLMVMGIAANPIFASTYDLVLGKYKIKAESTGIPQRMGRAVEFLAKHQIKPEIQIRQLEELDDMVNEMKAGKATKRMLVQF